MAITSELDDDSRPQRAGLGSKMCFFLAILLQLGMAGMMIVSQLSFTKKNMNRYVLIFYRNLTATVFLGPVAFYMEWGRRSDMNLVLFMQIIALGCLGPILDQGFSYLGLHWTSAAFDAGIANCVPAVTFFTAIVMGIERLRISEMASRAKLAGTVLTIVGTVLMTVFKGPVIPLPTSHQSHHGSSTRAEHHWLAGTAVLLLGVVATSLFYIVQSKAVRRYPPLSLASLICLSGAIQSAVVGVCIEQRASAWALGFDSRLLAVLYTGIVTSALTYYVQGMIMASRGPVFVAAFNPLCLVIVSVLGACILGEELHLGSVLGSSVILLGLYSILWGDSRDRAVEEPPVTTIRHAAELDIEGGEEVGTKGRMYWALD